MAVGRLLRNLGVARALARLPGKAGSAFAMLHATAPGRFSRRGSYAARLRSGAEWRASVTLFEGCVMRELYGHVHESTRAVLEANDYRVEPTRGQLCCGALHAHSGDLEKARELARKNIAAFESSGAAQVVVNAAGCGAMLKEYGHLLVNDAQWAIRAREFGARVRDVSETLASAGPRPAASLPVTIVYDAPCHLQHAQRIVNPPLAMLAAIPDAAVVQISDSDQCCGAAGIYNLVEPETSQAVLEPKLAGLQSARPDVICTGNPGCMMQIRSGLMRRGSQIPVAHPVEVLDYAYRRDEPGNSNGG
jgi:glycolate oxidase iron-sulfur subunit